MNTAIWKPVNLPCYHKYVLRHLLLENITHTPGVIPFRIWKLCVIFNQQPVASSGATDVFIWHKVVNLFWDYSLVDYFFKDLLKFLDTEPLSFSSPKRKKCPKSLYLRVPLRRIIASGWTLSFNFGSWLGFFWFWHSEIPGEIYTKH